MGRHQEGTNTPSRRTVLSAVGAVAVLVAVGSGLKGWLPWAGGGCTPTTVNLVVATAAEQAVRAVLAGAAGQDLGDGHCLRVDLRAQNGADTVASSTALPPSRAPQVWVPESSLWQPQVTTWSLRSTGSFAQSPVVVAASRSLVGRQGWGARPPAWSQVFGSTHTLAMADPTEDATATLAQVVLWDITGKGAAGNRAVTRAVLSTIGGGHRGMDSGLLQALADGRESGTLAVTSEVQVARVNGRDIGPSLVAIYPSDGSPGLDFPVLRVAPEVQDAARTRAVDAVVEALHGKQVSDQVRSHGLRDVAGRPPTGAGISAGTVVTRSLPSATELSAVSALVQSLSQPVRALVVVDRSASMSARSGGDSRLGLAVRGVRELIDLLPNSSAAGLWSFPAGSGVSQDRPVAPLTASARQALTGSAGRFVVGGASGDLGAATSQAVDHIRANFDAGAFNCVVVLTDAERGGVGALANSLRGQGGAGSRPVRLFFVGLGGADVAAMQRVAATTGGVARAATSPAEVHEAILDVLGTRAG